MGGRRSGVMSNIVCGGSVAASAMLMLVEVGASIVIEDAGH